MEAQTRSRGGRPRCFDREAAVDTAMRLFWQRGYEGVSVGDLTAAIGVAAPSLYAAFGSKAGLFREALGRYEALSTALDLSAVERAATLPEAVERLLRQGVDAATMPGRERGCMIASGMIACHPDHRDLALDLAGRRAALRDAIAARLGRFVDARRAAALARYLTALMQGMSIQARDGAGPAALDLIVDAALGQLGRETT